MEIGVHWYSNCDRDKQIVEMSVRDDFREINSAQVAVVVTVVNMSKHKLININLTITQRVIEEGRALVLVANKWLPCISQARDATSPERVARIACTRARCFCGTLRAHRQWTKEISTEAA